MTETLSVDEANKAVLAARSKRDRLVAEQRQIHEAAGGEPLERGQQERWDRLETGKARAQAEYDQAHEVWAEAIARALDNGTAGIEAGMPGDSDHVRAVRRADDAVRSAALRSIEADRFATDDAKQAGTALIEDDSTESSAIARWAAATSNPHYMRAWRSLFVDAERGHLAWSPQERQAFDEVQTLSRSMNIGTPASGGYMVPFALDPAIILTNDGTLSPLRDIAAHATIATDKWHGITSAGVSTEWKDEAAQVADATPTDLAQPTIPVHMADAYVKYTFEAEQDINSLVDQLRTVMLDAKANAEGAAFTTGSGTGQPKGVITAVAADSGSIVAPTTAETFAVADIYKVAAALPPRHQGNASWLANYVLEYTIRQFATGTGPSHAFWADLGAGTPPALVGKPYRGCSDMDGVWSAAATAAHNYLLLFGDFRKYMIVDRIGTTMETVPHVLGANGRPTGERGLLMYWRVGADCLDTNAFRLLDIPTTA
jgi:HK97 family phage major capsid protein